MKLSLLVAAILLGHLSYGANVDSCKNFDWSKYEIAVEPIRQILEDKNNAALYIKNIKESGQKYFKDNCNNIGDDADEILAFGERAAQACKSQCFYGPLTNEKNGPKLKQFCEQHCASLAGTFHDFNIGFQSGASTCRSAATGNSKKPSRGVR